MKIKVLIITVLLSSNALFAQFSVEERKIIDGITAEMCQCMEAEKMELTTYETFNAALMHCMNYDDSAYKALIDSVYIQKEDFDFVVKLPDAISKAIRTDCEIVSEFYLNKGIPDLANNIQYEVTGLTLAVEDMNAMKDFYANVFNVRFKEVEKMDTTLFEGKFAGLPLLLCPAQIIKVDAKGNRHQFDIEVNDLEKAKALVVANGGEVGEDIVGQVTVYDPDGNGIVLVGSTK